MKIAFDVDGVVLRSIDVILEHVNCSTGSNLRPGDLTGWDLAPLNLDARHLVAAVHHMYAQPAIDHYPGALEVLSHIYRATGRPLLFITGRSDPQTARFQLEALPWDCSVPEMIVTGGSRDKRKHLAETAADFIVEDDIKYVQSYLDGGIGVGLMLQPWNRGTDVPVTARFSGWQDVGRWFLDTTGR
jgi:hypothetical protein